MRFYQERISGAKLLQRVSGVRPAVLWVSALVWDWLWLLLIYLCIVITLACFQESSLSTPEELGNATTRVGRASRCAGGERAVVGLAVATANLPLHCHYAPSLLTWLVLKQTRRIFNETDNGTLIPLGMTLLHIKFESHCLHMYCFFLFF